MPITYPDRIIYLKGSKKEIQPIKSIIEKTYSEAKHAKIDPSELTDLVKQYKANPHKALLDRIIIGSQYYLYTSIMPRHDKRHTENAVDDVMAQQYLLIETIKNYNPSKGSFINFLKCNIKRRVTYTHITNNLVHHTAWDIQKGLAKNKIIINSLDYNFKKDDPENLHDIFSDPNNYQKDYEWQDTYNWLCKDLNPTEMAIVDRYIMGCGGYKEAKKSLKLKISANAYDRMLGAILRKILYRAHIDGLYLNKKISDLKYQYHKAAQARAKAKDSYKDYYRKRNKENKTNKNWRLNLFMRSDRNRERIKAIIKEHNPRTLADHLCGDIDHMVTSAIASLYFDDNFKNEKDILKVAKHYIDSSIVITDDDDKIVYKFRDHSFLIYNKKSKTTGYTVGAPHG